MEIKPIRVGLLNDYIGDVLSRDGILSNVRVIGEIANLTEHSTGHSYFSLKDEDSTIKCFFSKFSKEDMKLSLEEGKSVIVEGNISVFKRGGYYSINVKSVEIEGLGDVNRQFELTKKKLMEEGLFDSIYKRDLPEFPNKIAVVTSPTGAAIEDILRTLSERNKAVDILIFPVLVQGKKAPEDIVFAIDFINENLSDEIDLIIVGRGGGSAEDLWAFNHENVARSIFNSKIPIISAVGHEIDVTIADMVADYRAATPTAAAVVAVPSNGNLLAILNQFRKRADDYFENYMDRGRYRLCVLREKVGGLSPENALKRGYGAILDEKRNLITSIENVKKDDLISVLMKDGELLVEIKQIKIK